MAVELLDEAGTTVLDTTTTDRPAGLHVRAHGAGHLPRPAGREQLHRQRRARRVHREHADAADAGQQRGQRQQRDHHRHAGQPGGVILSGPIALADGTEPTDDGDTDNNTNLTVDFGVFPR